MISKISKPKSWDRAKILIVDNHSKFLPNLIRVLKKSNMGQKNIKKVNSLRSKFKKINPNEFYCVILSGGPDTNWKRKSKFNGKIIEKFKTKPVLGICLGHEFLVEHYGGKVVKMKKPVKGFTRVIISRKNKLSPRRKTIYVYKAHQNKITFLPRVLKNLAFSKEGNFEIVEHKKRLHFGVQFHPEKSGKDGIMIFKNFLKICKTK